MALIVLSASVALLSFVLVCGVNLVLRYIRPEDMPFIKLAGIVLVVAMILGAVL